MPDASAGRVRQQAGRLIIVGPFPPPKHGVSAMNESVLQAARAENLAVTVFDTAPASLERNLRTKLGRLGKIRTALRGVAEEAGRGEATVYLSLSGGPGLIWEALIAWRARRAGARLLVHHHSFRYLDAPYRPMNWLVKGAGARACHIVLCRRMGDILASRYPEVGRILVMSNAALLSAPPAPAPAQMPELRVIGFLSNLSPAKGMFEVLDLAAAALRTGHDFRLQIAGPFEDRQHEAEFRARLRHLPNTDYVGPVHGDAKERFLAGLGALVFPTRYRNEAEPLVILEALRHGCPAIAFARGCIPSLLEADCGLAVPLDGNFTDAALAVLARWQSDRRAFLAARRAAQEQYHRLQSASADARVAFMHELKGRG